MSYPPTLLTDLTSDLYERRLAAIQRVRQQQDSTFLDPLIVILQDTTAHIDTRTTVAETLGLIGNRGALQPLLAQLRPYDTIPFDSYEETICLFQAVIEALGRLGDTRVVPLLLPYVCPNQDLCEVAIGALAALHAVEATATIIAALAADEPSIVEAAAGALGRLGAREACEPLVHAALVYRGSQDEPAHACILALLQLHDDRAFGLMRKTLMYKPQKELVAAAVTRLAQTVAHEGETYCLHLLHELDTVMHVQILVGLTTALLRRRDQSYPTILNWLRTHCELCAARIAKATNEPFISA